MTAMSEEIEVAAGAASVPTEREIAPVVEQAMRDGDCNVLTIRMVMNTVSQHFEVAPEDLAVHKKFIRELMLTLMDEIDEPG